LVSMTCLRLQSEVTCLLVGTGFSPSRIIVSFLTLLQHMRPSPVKRPAPYTKKFWVPFYISVVVTVIAIFIFLAEASLRHSSAAATPKSMLVLFPIPVALSSALGPLALLLGLAQFPTYGILLGIANENGRLFRRLLQIVAIHASLAAIGVWVVSV